MCYTHRRYMRSGALTQAEVKESDILRRAEGSLSFTPLPFKPSTTPRRARGFARFYQLVSLRHRGTAPIAFDPPGREISVAIVAIIPGLGRG